METYRWEVYTRETGLGRGVVEPPFSSSGGLSDPTVELWWALQNVPVLRQGMAGDLYPCVGLSPDTGCSEERAGCFLQLRVIHVRDPLQS